MDEQPLTFAERRLVVRLSLRYARPPDRDPDDLSLYYTNIGIESVEQDLPWEDDPHRAVCLQDMAWTRAERIHSRREQSAASSLAAPNDDAALSSLHETIDAFVRESPEWARERTLYLAASIDAAIDMIREDEE